MKKALLVTLLSIGTVASSAVAAFVCSGSATSEADIAVIVVSYNDFVSKESNVNVNGEFKLVINRDIETYCSVNAVFPDEENDGCVGSYRFEWDEAFDSYFSFANYEGNFENGIAISSPIVTWKENMRPLTNGDCLELQSALKNKDIRISFEVSKA